MIARIIALFRRRPASARPIGTVRIVPVRPSRRGTLIPIAAPSGTRIDCPDPWLALVCGAAIRAQRVQLLEWLAVGAAYRRAVESTAVADWTAYDRARDLYGEHVREDEP